MRKQSRFFFYKKYILNWKRQGVLNNLTVEKKSKTFLSKVTLSISIRNLISFEDINIVKALFFLEFISGQRPFVNKMRSFSLKSKKKSINFNAKVDLRKQNMFFFLEHFVEYIKLNLDKKYIKYNILVNNEGNFTLFIKDISVFIGLDILGLGYEYPVKVDFILENSNKEKTLKFFQEYNLHLV